VNPFLRHPAAFTRTPIRAERPAPKAGDAGAVALRLYDPIDSYGGEWGVSAKEFVAVLDELPADTTEIRLLVNSPGGEVWEGLAILNALRAHPARVVAVVEGIAASSASFIAAGVDELVMMENAELFVHRAWGLAIGNAVDLRKLADELEHEDRNLASIYAAKTGAPVDDWLAAMSADTWYSAEEAVAAKLADRVMKPAGGADKGAVNRWDRTVLARAGHHTVPAASESPAPPGSPSGRGTPVEFTDEQLAGLRNTLGVGDDATAEDMVTAAEHLRETAAAPGAETPAAPVQPEGTVVVDEQTLNQLRADAAAGRQARDQQEADRRASLVSAAIADGRIAPARRQAWLDTLTRDPGAEETLNSLAKGLVPLAEVGHTGGQAGSEPTEDDALLKSLGFDVTPKVGA